MFVYESHLGGIYTSEDYLDCNYTYCEACGDSDYCIGNYPSAEAFLMDFADEIDSDGRGGYDLAFILDSLYGFDNVPDYETAEEIVKTYRTDYDFL